MLASQRQSHIAEQLGRNGAVRVVEMADELDVSEMTVRRDLESMHAAGLLVKVHGGAVPLARSTEEPGFDAKMARMTPEKAAIADLAAGLVGAGASVAVSAGTTTWALAERLPPDVMIVTNSVHLAEALHREGRDQSVILTGGVRTPSGALVGPISDTAIRSMYFDLLFLGVHGMDPEAGFTTPNMAEAATNRTLIECARRTVVLADHTKWRTIGMSRIAPLAAADVVVTDDGLDDAARERLGASVGALLVADTAVRATGT